MRSLYRGHFQWPSTSEEADECCQFSAWHSRLPSLIWPNLIFRLYHLLLPLITLHCCQTKNLASHTYLLYLMHTTFLHWKCPSFSKKLFFKIKLCVCVGEPLCL